MKVDSVRFPDAKNLAQRAILLTEWQLSMPRDCDFESFGMLLEP
jgi:hypothetical protein